MTSIMTHCVVLLVICFFIVSVLSHSVWEPLLLDCCHLSFQSPNAYILSVCFCRLFFKRNCDFKFARIAQKSSKVRLLSYRHQILCFRKPLNLRLLRLLCGKNHHFSHPKSIIKSPRQSILPPHSYCFSLQNILFCLARHIVSVSKMYCFASPEDMNCCFIKKSPGL